MAFNGDMRPFIGTDQPSRLIKRAKGIRFRKTTWISKDRDIWPVRGLADAHLFFIYRSILKFANNSRWEKINRLWEITRSKKDQYGRPVSETEALKQIDELKQMSHEECVKMAFKDYPILTDVSNELRHRGINPDSETAAEHARLEVAERQKREAMRMK